MSELDQLPPRREGATKSNDDERIYRTALGTRDYLRLEVEAMERGIKPFGLTKQVMTLYLNRKLVFVADLPADLQQQIAAHYQKNAKPV
jgi:hypothetical protein